MPEMLALLLPALIRIIEEARTEDIDTLQKLAADALARRQAAVDRSRAQDPKDEPPTA